MKATQLLNVEIDSIKLKVQFQHIDSRMIPIVARLEKEGDIFGPVAVTIDGKCVSIRYADKRRPAVKPTIFGYDSDEFISRQYK